MDWASRDRFYRRNVIGVSAVEFLWGLGLPVVVESTFLQLFLDSLGASRLGLGLIPFFFILGTSVFALLSSYWTEGLAFKRGAVVWLHVVSGAALLAFGGILLLVDPERSVMGVFFACYAVFSVCVGMTLPVWLNYLVKIFSPERTVSGLGAMLVAQNLAKLASSLALVQIVERWAFDRGAAGLVFLAVGGLFSLGSFFFYLTREPADQGREPGRRRPPFGRFIGRTLHHMLGNRNFLLFLAGDLGFYVVVTVISFYAAYATAFGGVPAATAAGVFVALIYAGAVASNLALGTLGWLTLKGKALFSNATAVAAVLPLVLPPSAAGFYAASLLLGLSRGARMIAHPPIVKKLSGLEDATAYFAVSPLLTLPVAAGLPLLCGRFLDRFAALGGDAYRLVFGVFAACLLAALLCTRRADFAARRD